MSYSMVYLYPPSPELVICGVSFIATMLVVVGLLEFRK